jgi:hypothetical protein
MHQSLQLAIPFFVTLSNSGEEWKNDRFEPHLFLLQRQPLKSSPLYANPVPHSSHFLFAYENGKTFPSQHFSLFFAFFIVCIIMKSTNGSMKISLSLNIAQVMLMRGRPKEKINSKFVPKRLIMI